MHWLFWHHLHYSQKVFRQDYQTGKGTNPQVTFPIGIAFLQNETYQVSSDCISLQTTDSTHHLSPSKPSARQVDPAANLTFDLHLSTQEKAARSRVVLPYTSAQQGGEQGTGEIFYEPDEVDFEDSDPDDDLDF